MEKPDESLVRRAAAGDKDAFTSLVLGSEALLSHAAMALLGDPEDAADAVQEAVLLAWQRLPTLRQPQYFHTWLTRILIRECWRERKRRDKHRHGELTELPDESASQDRDDALDVRDALGRLKREDRLTLTLYYRDGLDTKELGKALGVGEAAARQRLHRSRERFRAAYMRKEDNQ